MCYSPSLLKTIQLLCVRNVMIICNCSSQILFHSPIYGVAKLARLYISAVHGKKAHERMVGLSLKMDIDTLTHCWENGSTLWPSGICLPLVLCLYIVQIPACDCVSGLLWILWMLGTYLIVLTWLYFFINWFIANEASKTGKRNTYNFTLYHIVLFCFQCVF